MTKDFALLIDAGTGNLHSILNTLQSLDFNIKITNNPEDLIQSNRIILPGVGAFGKFMDGLHKFHLEDALFQVIKRGDPLLGICVGMQALFETSEEMGCHAGLGFLPGRVPRFAKIPGLKIPHTGWNQLWSPENSASPLLEGVNPGSYAYFNHSYYCLPENTGDIAGFTDYGIDFCSVVQRNFLFGVQFHPEKSQQVGAQILTNFMRL
jgi:imidazole glycerol-phosphate synthase subunit HisH